MRIQTQDIAETALTVSPKSALSISTTLHNQSAVSSVQAHCVPTVEFWQSKNSHLILLSYGTPGEILHLPLLHFHSLPPQFPLQRQQLQQVL